MLNFHHNCLQLSFNFDNYIYVIVIKVLLPHRQKHFIQIFAFMCCLFIVCIMIGVSNKAYSDTCDCLLNEFQVTPLHKQLQEHTSNWEYIRLSSGYVVAVSVTASWRSHLSICVCLCVSTGCYKITTVFSHAQTVVLCVGCSTVLCQPTGGKARLTEGTQCVQREETGCWFFLNIHKAPIHTDTYILFC